MALLKCFEGFVPSENQVYSEEEMRKINIDMLKERGVSVDDIAYLSYWAQSKYLDNLSIDEMKDSVLEILGKRDQFHALLIAINVDVLAEKGMLDEPLASILNKDLGLFGIDEALAISVAGNYGTIGVTNFGNMDVNKPGKISILQNDRMHCHCFLDDMVGAIAAVAAIRVAQKHALAKAMGQLDLE